MIKYIIIHHTAVSRMLNPDQWKQTDAYHKQKFNMLSSLGYWGGYNYEISAGGSIKQFRADGEETAAQVGHNKDSISICMDLNGDIEMPTEAQIQALKSLVRQKMKAYMILPSNVVSHRRFSPKSCPGKLISDQWITDLGKIDVPEACITEKNTIKSLIDYIARWIIGRNFIN